MRALGRYELQGELGRGAFAVVHRARDPEGREVALKVVAAPRDPAARERWRKRVEREARVLARLEHPGLIKVREAWVEESRAILVTDLVAGESLRAVLDRRRALPVEDALALVETIARALHHAHEQGVVHRDLKPENVLVDRAGRPILIDFGVAKDTAHEAESLTQTGALVGTPLYLAPEQARGDSTVDARADTWSLGVLLYELLAGAPPFRGATLLELAQALEHEQPAPPVGLDGRPVGPAGSVALRALAKDRDERTPTALAFAEQCAAARGAAPRPARRTTLVAALGAGAVALGAVAWSALSSSGGAPARDPSPRDVAAVDSSARFAPRVADLEGVLDGTREPGAIALLVSVLDREPALAPVLAARVAARPDDAYRRVLGATDSPSRERLAVVELARALARTGDPRLLPHETRLAARFEELARAALDDKAVTFAKYDAACSFLWPRVALLRVRVEPATLRAYGSACGVLQLTNKPTPARAVEANALLAGLGAPPARFGVADDLDELGTAAEELVRRHPRDPCARLAAALATISATEGSARKSSLATARERLDRSSAARWLADFRAETAAPAVASFPGVRTLRAAERLKWAQALVGGFAVPAELRRNPHSDDGASALVREAFAEARALGHGRRDEVDTDEAWLLVARANQFAVADPRRAECAREAIRLARGAHEFFEAQAKVLAALGARASTLNEDELRRLVVADVTGLTQALSMPGLRGEPFFIETDALCALRTDARSPESAAAIAALRAGLAFAPSDGQRHHELATLLLEQGDAEGALDHATRACEDDPANAEWARLRDELRRSLEK